MAIHQQTNSIGYDIYNAYIYKNVSWYQHFHKSYELIFVIKGTIKVKVNDQIYLLNQDDFLFIPSFSLHTIENASTNSLTYIAVFSKKYIEAFASFFDNKITQNYSFNLQPLDKNFFIEKTIGKDFLTSKKIDNIDTTSIKEGLYIVLSEFIKQTKFITSQNRSELILNIVEYIEQNYQTDINLTMLSKKIGYDYAYLSRLFNNTFNFSFSYMVNLYRVEKAIDLIQNTNDSFTEISSNCGFSTVRNFNRTFKTILNITPSEYKTNLLKNPQ